MKAANHLERRNRLGKDERTAAQRISGDSIRGYTDIIVLYLIRNEPDYGYSISKRIRSKSAEKYAIKETTLYSAFTRLEKNGFIESFDGTISEGGRRTYYRITEAGSEYYRIKCDEWQLTKEVVDKFIATTAN